jgi:hypothetical protein
MAFPLCGGPAPPRRHPLSCRAGCRPAISSTTPETADPFDHRGEEGHGIVGASMRRALANFKK